MATTATVKIEIVVKPSSSIPCFGSLTKETCAQIEEIQSGCGAKEPPAWNKPSDVVGVAAPEVAPVMGDVFWPDLSESARASLKSLSHGSITTPEGMAAGSLSSKKEDATTSASAPNLRHKSVKHRSGGSNQSSSKQTNNGSVYQPPPPAQGAIIGGAPLTKSGGGSFPMESNRENTYRDGGVGFTSYRNIGGPRPPPPPLPPQVDGLYHGVRPKHDPHRSYGIQHRGVRPFIRGPPPPIAPFIPPPPPPPPFGPRPIVNPMVYPDVPPPPPPPPHFYYVSGGPPPRQDFFRSMPMRMPMLPIPPMFFPVQKPGLSSQILKQIEYYFSNDNLVKDIFLRQNMDAEGWVSIILIAGFRKVMQLTDSIQLIKDSMQSSNVVEVQADKLRRKNDWSRWIIQLPAQSAST